MTIIFICLAFIYIFMIALLAMICYVLEGPEWFTDKANILMLLVAPFLFVVDIIKESFLKIKSIWKRK